MAGCAFHRQTASGAACRSADYLPGAAMIASIRSKEHINITHISHHMADESHNVPHHPLTAPNSPLRPSSAPRSLSAPRSHQNLYALLNSQPERPIKPLPKSSKNSQPPSSASLLTVPSNHRNAEVQLFSTPKPMATSGSSSHLQPPGLTCEPIIGRTRKHDAITIDGLLPPLNIDSKC